MSEEEEIVYNALFSKFYKLIYGRAYRERRNFSDAQDIAQETFIVLAKNIGEVMKYERPDSWLLKVARHQIFHYYRNMHTEDSLDERGYSPSVQPDIDLVEIDLPDYLSDIDRRILCYHLYGFTLEEIADMIKINFSTCRGRHSKIIKKMEAHARKKKLLK